MKVIERDICGSSVRNWFHVTVIEPNSVSSKYSQTANDGVHT
jgi:hypothetical protein